MPFLQMRIEIPAPELTEQEIEDLLAGETVSRFLGEIQQFSVFPVGDRIACCYYASKTETWFKLLTEEETAYMNEHTKDVKE